MSIIQINQCLESTKQQRNSNKKRYSSCFGETNNNEGNHEELSNPAEKTEGRVFRNVLTHCAHSLVVELGQDNHNKRKYLIYVKVILVDSLQNNQSTKRVVKFKIHHLKDCVVVAR